MTVPPAQCVKRADAPETVVVEVVIVLIGVVIDRITRWIVVVDPSGLMANHIFWLVIGYVNHLIVSGFDDDRVVFDVHILFVVRIDVARGVGLLTHVLNSIHYVAFLIGNRLAEFPRPIDVVIQECEGFGVVE